MSTNIAIDTIAPDEARLCLPDLVALLQDAVDGGASVGFLPPLDEEIARIYWEDVIDDVEVGRRLLLVARRSNVVVGTVQLVPATMPNARHRAEVQKLLVQRFVRRQGIGTALMTAAAEVATRLGRTLLTLDTRQGDPAERLYRALGYTAVGIIPAYALNATGGLDATVIFYTALE